MHGANIKTTVMKLLQLQKLRLSDRIRQSHKINPIRSNYTEVRGPACSSSTMYLGGPGFKFRAGYRPSWVYQFPSVPWNQMSGQ